MRSFIAIEMQAEGIKEIQNQLRRANADIKFVEFQNLHFTLKFLGEIREEVVDDIHKIMEESFKGIRRFNVNLKGVGVFPDVRKIRVVWVGIDENKELLIDMQERLEENISKLGFRRDKRFTPHLTIGRVKSAKNKEKLVEMIEAMNGIEIDKISIDRVLLKKSVLTPKGPIYTLLKEVVL